MARIDANLIGWIVLIAAAVFAAVAVTNPYLSSIVILIAIGALLGASLRFVMLMGEVNFALGAFVGIGAYTAGLLHTAAGLNFALAILVGASVSMVVGTTFGAITLRAKGPYFMLIGFAFTEAVRVAYSKFAVLGGTSGMVGIFPPRALDLWMPLIVVLTVIVFLVVLAIAERSDFGRILFAIGENEPVARSVGLNTFRSKVAALAVTSATAGIAGGLHAFTNNVISPGDFSFLLPAFALAYVKVGGENHFFGPILGAAFLIALSHYALGFGANESFLYGGAIVLSVLLMPGGMLGLASRAVAAVRKGPSSHD